MDYFAFPFGSVIVTGKSLFRRLYLGLGLVFPRQTRKTCLVVVRMTAARIPSRLDDVLFVWSRKKDGLSDKVYASLSPI
jgi:hypothetical protein